MLYIYIIYAPSSATNVQPSPFTRHWMVASQRCHLCESNQMEIGQKQKLVATIANHPQPIPSS